MSDHTDEAQYEGEKGCVHGLVWGCRDCMIDRFTRERDEAEVRAAAAEDRAQEAEASRDEWKWLYERMRGVVKEHRARIAELEEALRGLLLSRDASWTGGHDWQDAVDRAAALLIPTTPTAGAVERKLCGRPIDDEHGNPTDQPCGFTRPCIYHDAPASKQAVEEERDA